MSDLNLTKHNVLSSKLFLYPVALIFGVTVLGLIIPNLEAMLMLTAIMTRALRPHKK